VSSEGRQIIPSHKVTHPKRNCDTKKTMRRRAGVTSLPRIFSEQREERSYCESTTLSQRPSSSRLAPHRRVKKILLNSMDASMGTDIISLPEVSWAILQTMNRRRRFLFESFASDWTFLYRRYLIVDKHIGLTDVHV